MFCDSQPFQRFPHKILQKPPIRTCAVAVKCVKSLSDNSHGNVSLIPLRSLSPQSHDSLVRVKLVSQWQRRPSLLHFYQLRHQNKWNDDEDEDEEGDGPGVGWRHGIDPSRALRIDVAFGCVDVELVVDTTWLGLVLIIGY